MDERRLVVSPDELDRTKCATFRELGYGHLALEQDGGVVTTWAPYVEVTRTIPASMVPEVNDEGGGEEVIS